MKFRFASTMIHSNHPRGLYPPCCTALWERCSHYGMRALLPLFMVAPLAIGGLGYDNRRTGMSFLPLASSVPA
ncbi:MAG: hypothetical protein NTW21_35220 [Verrucomicrobia bacterium]|nr:hypothetical protein [Verrucomicrobiota bacterium]